MQVHFLGGADEVGASSLLVDFSGGRILVDAGIRMGGRVGDRLPHFALLDEVGRPDAVVVTHAHLDHSGVLPMVHATMPKTPVITTKATASLLRILLLDAIKVMEIQGAREEEIPLYPKQAVEALLARIRTANFYEPIMVANGKARLTFFPAGHVLGAASVGIETDEGSVLVTGDVSITDQHTVPGMPKPDFQPDLLITESTYGARLHASRRAEESRLVEGISEVLESGGKVLVPAFALGRAQEVLLILRRALAKLPPEANIYVDGMVRYVNRVYELHPDFLTPRLREKATKGKRLFHDSQGRVRDVSSPEMRQAVLEGGPSVIVSSSGMLSGGPSAWYASRLAENSKALIAITGYQDEEAPGRKLQDLASGLSSQIVLEGSPVTVRCKVATYGLSAHADAQELAGLASALRPGGIALVHGDREARLGLARILVDRGFEDIFLPGQGGFGERETRGNQETTTHPAGNGARPPLRRIGCGGTAQENRHRESVRPPPPVVAGTC